MRFNPKSLYAVLLCGVLFLSGCDDSHENRMACIAGNMSNTRRALQDIAEEHDGILPTADNWRQTVLDFLGPDWNDITICPIDGSPYQYYGSGVNLKQYDDPLDMHNRILLVCPREHCRNQLHVVFVDGHWSYVPKELVKKAVQECASGQLPRMNPPTEELPTTEIINCGDE